MSRVLYYDCFAGISGDMHLAALIDAGVPVEYLLEELKKVPISDYNLKIEKVITHGITATQVNVKLQDNSFIKAEFTLKNKTKHFHNAYLPKEERTFSDIKKIILQSSLSEKVKELSLKIFSRLADAEGKVHNISPEKVHFHEVGAVDSIIDIIGAAICIDFFNPDMIFCSTVELGGGMINCAHGVYPVPAPATAELLKNIPISLGRVPFEATTPTGAAIIASVVNSFDTLPQFKIYRIGYGAGHKKSHVPNVLRVFLGDMETSRENNNLVQENAFIIECNIDDMNPEIYESVLDDLFEMGVQDVYITPIFMKKYRPANKLSVLCANEIKEKVVLYLLKHTTTLGIREYWVNKQILPREIIYFNSSLGQIRVKRSFINDTEKFKPEYEDCLAIARQKGLPLIEVLHIVQNEISKKYLKKS